ncbi:MAG: hypothetical protein HZC14_01100 [Candidatus Niyogibacteria bacterium]|nr:hypothetical protein [Candidatus Niyogibacteria bacterium]
MSPSTQQIIPISEIRDDVITLKDGSLRMILMASSINFALKSKDEQTAIISQYQFFLNTLDFSMQFFIQSSELDISPYLGLLKTQEKTQTNELLKVQTREYAEFIKNFVEAAHIMSKTFYISVPYTPNAMKAVSGGISGIFQNFMGKNKTSEKISGEQFTEYKNQLWQRMDIVSSGLARCGVHTVPLKTEELIELFYGIYNPGEIATGLLPEIKQ